MNGRTARLLNRMAARTGGVRRHVKRGWGQANARQRAGLRRTFARMLALSYKNKPEERSLLDRVVDRLKAAR